MGAHGGRDPWRLRDYDDPLGPIPQFVRRKAAADEHRTVDGTNETRDPCSSPRAQAMTVKSRQPDWSKLWRLFVIWGTAIAAVSASIITFQSGFGLRKFGGLEYVPRLLALALVREMGPGAATSAALIGLVHWTHRYDVDQLRSCLGQVRARGYLGSIVMLPVATLVALASSFSTAFVVYGITWATYSSGMAETLAMADFAVALGGTFVSGLILMLTSLFLLPTFARFSWSLPVKLLATCSCLVTVHIFLSAAVRMQSLLPCYVSTSASHSLRNPSAQHDSTHPN